MVDSSAFSFFFPSSSSSKSESQEHPALPLPQPDLSDPWQSEQQSTTINEFLSEWHLYFSSQPSLQYVHSESQPLPLLLAGQTNVGENASMEPHFDQRESFAPQVELGHIPIPTHLGFPNPNIPDSSMLPLQPSAYTDSSLNNPDPLLCIQPWLLHADNTNISSPPSGMCVSQHVHTPVADSQTLPSPVSEDAPSAPASHSPTPRPAKRRRDAAYAAPTSPSPRPAKRLKIAGRRPAPKTHHIKNWIEVISPPPSSFVCRICPEPQSAGKCSGTMVTERQAVRDHLKSCRPVAKLKDIRCNWDLGNGKLCTKTLRSDRDVDGKGSDGLIKGTVTLGTPAKSISS
ncbi:uncharacterized protein FIBRA_08820 [Fibroporia radiculosa]|uniref:Uncharacterized protein n=1 Tax=Fibroporia radiculosa TaxID=599839 RepID=J4ICK0_9APHY|nr:uncharacterized protein FIBRA_08820 [Fibroporia radiculosa]CCM06546.1 predicted protein [Fibroporia radiculosa]